LIGPRIYTSGHWSIAGNVGSPFIDSTVPDYVLQKIRAYKAAGFDFIKVHDENLNAYRQVVAAAKQVGIPVAGHVPDGIPLDTVLAAHQASIEHLTGYDVGDTAKTRALVAATKAAGVWNCPTLDLAYDPVAAHSRFTKALQDGGAGLLSGTDWGGWCDEMWSPNWDVAVLAREFQAMVHAGLTPYQVLATSTRNVAQYFGTLQETGTVEVGKRADLALANGNPLTDIKNATDITGVVLNGHWFTRVDLRQRLANLHLP
jgi:imidazolonepropionase-like amidohydrolase